MKFWLPLLLILWMNYASSCEPALPNPNVNKDWFTVSHFKKATLVVKAKIIKNTDESSLFNFFNQTIKNEYLLIETLETYKGKPQNILRINLRTRVCGNRELLNIGEERLFYLSLNSDKNYFSVAYAESIKFKLEDIEFLKAIINKKIKPNEVPMLK